MVDFHAPEPTLNISFLIIKTFKLKFRLKFSNIAQLGRLDTKEASGICY